MKPILPLSLAALMIAVGCSDGTSQPPATNAPLTLDTFPAAYFNAVCTAVFRCPAGGDAQEVSALFENQAVCAERAARLLNTDVNDLVALARAGSLRFDADAARACLDRVVAACVVSDSELQRACARAFTGTVAVGSPCWRAEQCVDGAWCEHNSDNPSISRACPGTCRAQVSLGAMCNENRACSGWREGTATCDGRVCIAVRTGTPASEGQPCGDIETPDGPLTRTACTAGLSCRRGVCRRPLAVGAPCNESTDVCAIGSVCVARPGAMATTCTPGSDIVRHSAGGSCDPTPGRLPMCNPTARLTCNPTTRTCESMGDGAMGSRCLPGGDFNTVTCNAGFRCDSMTRTCIPRLAVGAACENNTDCLSGECEAGRCLEHLCR